MIRREHVLCACVFDCMCVCVYVSVCVCVNMRTVRVRLCSYMLLVKFIVVV